MIIKPITRQTCDQAVQVLGQAFMTDPVSMAVYHNLSADRMLQALVNDFQAEFRLSERRGCPILAQEGDQVLGAAMIYPPGGYPLPVLDQWRLLISSVIKNGLYDVRAWIRWLDEVERFHPTEPHYYLAYIGVHPGFQGQGVGSAMLKHLMGMADAALVGCYLENANPRNLPFYQRSGFQVSKELEIIGLKTWLMWRPPGMSATH
jgi:ribosomal protein S18 acetylase RimI-like enzyme